MRGHFGSKRFLSDSILGIVFVLVYQLTLHYVSFLAWFVHVPLLIFLYKRPVKEGVLFALFFGTITILIGAQWLLTYSWFVFMLMSLIMVFFICFFSAITSYYYKKINGILSIFVAPFVYLILVFGFSFTPVSSYWAEWSIFQPLAPLIWFIGSKGMLFLILLVSSAIACLFVTKKKILRKQIVFLLGFIGIIIFSSILFSLNYETKGKEVSVALVQGNFAEEWEWRQEHALTDVLDKYEMLSLEAAQSNIDIIVWPEYALATDILRNDDALKRLSDLAVATNSYLVIGAYELLAVVDENGVEQRHDIALVFDSDGNLVGEYRSVKPLPFDSEVVPFDRLEVFDTNLGRFSIGMCYEETQDTFLKAAKKSPEFMISLANNQRFMETNGMRLSSLYTNLHAAEHGRYVVRTTNNGITKIINSVGIVVGELDPYVQEVLIGTIKLQEKDTFYTEYGDSLLVIVLAILFLLFLRKTR